VFTNHTNVQKRRQSHIGDPGQAAFDQIRLVLRGARGRAARPAHVGLVADHIHFPLLNSPERGQHAGARYG